MKNVLSKIDWFQIGVIGLGLTASLVKSIYETKRFNEIIDKNFDGNLEKRVNEIVDKKLKNK